MKDLMAGVFTAIDFHKNRFKEIRFFGKIGFLTKRKYLSENGGDKFI
jgi:hypothetical protein